MEILVKVEHRWLTGALFLLAMGLWVALVRLAGSPGPFGWTGAVSTGATLIALALTLVGALVMVPGSSTDVNSYAMYGHMVADLDANPYIFFTK